MPDYDPDHLRRLLEAASPRPWHRGAGDHYAREVRTEADDAVAWCGGFPDEQARADAALVAAAVNALPVLLDRVRELEGALGEACREWEDEMIDLHAPRTGPSWDTLDRLRAVLAREGGT